MQQKQNRIRTIRITGIFVIFVVLAATAIVTLQHNRTDATPAVKPAAGAAVASQFSFTGATGWWQGATNKTSMAVFRSSHDCFISGEHDSGTITVAAELQKEQNLMMHAGYTVTPTSTQTLTLGTSQLQYALHQYAVTGSGSAGQVDGGQEFGYVQLSSGYLKIMGYCNTADELPSTIPALQAVKFDAAD